MSTTKTKRAIPTRRILEESIKDIEAGLWTCGDLCDWNRKEGAVKPLGCALGLVGVNAGLGKTVHRDGAVFVTGLSYPDKKWPKSALKAVQLLAQTARASRAQREEAAEEAINDPAVYAISVEQGIVWRVNDSGNMTSRKALNWFKRALKALDAA